MDKLGGRFGFQAAERLLPQVYRVPVLPQVGEASRAGGQVCFEALAHWPAEIPEQILHEELVHFTAGHECWTSHSEIAVLMSPAATGFAPRRKEMQWFFTVDSGLPPLSGCH
jgi:hypothetical protein